MSTFTHVHELKSVGGLIADPYWQLAIKSEKKVCRGGLGVVTSEKDAKEKTYAQYLQILQDEGDFKKIEKKGKHIIMTFLSNAPAAKTNAENVQGLIVAVYPSANQLVSTSQKQRYLKPIFHEQVQSKREVVDVLAICVREAGKDEPKRQKFEIGTKLWRAFLSQIETRPELNLGKNKVDFALEVRDGRLTLDAEGKQIKFAANSPWKGNVREITVSNQDGTLKSKLDDFKPALPKLVEFFEYLGFQEAVPYAEFPKKDSKSVWINSNNDISYFMYGSNEDIVKRAKSAEKKQFNKPKPAHYGQLAKHKVAAVQDARKKAQEAAKKAAVAEIKRKEAEDAERKRKIADEAAARLATEEAARKAEQAKKDAESKANQARKAEEAAKKAEEAAKKAEQEAKVKEMENRLAAQKAREEKEARKQLTTDVKYPPPPSRSRSSSKSPPTTPPSSPEPRTPPSRSPSIRQASPIQQRPAQTLTLAELKKLPFATNNSLYLALTQPDTEEGTLDEDDLETRQIYTEIAGNERLKRAFTTYMAREYRRRAAPQEPISPIRLPRTPSKDANIIGTVSKAQLPAHSARPRRRPATTLPPTLPTQTGKGGKGKRRRPRPQDTMKGITKNGIRRLARRGGVKRISGAVYDDVRDVLKSFLKRILFTTTTYTEHAKRKTVTSMDVVHALKRDGRPLYGFGG